VCSCDAQAEEDPRLKRHAISRDRVDSSGAVCAARKGYPSNRAGIDLDGARWRRWRILGPLANVSKGRLPHWIGVRAGGRRHASLGGIEADMAHGSLGSMNRSKSRRMTKLLLFAWLLITTDHPEAGAQAKRQLVFNPGVTIASQLTPDDRVVEIDGSAPLKGFFSGHLTPADLIRAHALDAQAILVVRIDRMVPHLTPQGDWIRTTYEASITESLRLRKRATPRAVRIDLDGGTLTIQGVTVTANAEWEPRFEAGARYLLFVNQMRDPVDGIWAYKIGDKELLESTWDAFYSHGAADSVHGVPLAEARRLLNKTGQ